MRVAEGQKPVESSSQELFTQMHRIREKATESEAIVRDITKDIQILDLAKKNLILSMTTLKRFQMLGERSFIIRTSVLTPDSQCPRSARRVSRRKEVCRNRRVAFCASQTYRSVRR